MPPIGFYPSNSIVFKGKIQTKAQQNAEGCAPPALRQGLLSAPWSGSGVKPQRNPLFAFKFTLENNTVSIKQKKRAGLFCILLPAGKGFQPPAAKY